MREVVRRVACTRRRCKNGTPARVLGQAILIGLTDAGLLGRGVRIIARFHRQVGPLGDAQVERIGRPSQPARAGDGLRRGCAGADLRSAVGERDAAIRRELKLGEARFGPGAEASLDAAEADPVMVSGVRGVVGLLARGAAGPQRMAAGPLQHRLGALRPERDRALGVPHPGLQHVAQTELDRVEAELAGDLVHHQLGRCQGFRPAVAARRAAVDGA